jgi:Zn-dependent M28 family amino/carboxypeptidase
MRTPRSIRIAVGLSLATLGGFVAIGACVSQPFVRATASNPPRVDADRLRTHVEQLSAMKRGPDNLEPAIAYIEKSLPNVVRQPFLVAGRTYNNLIVSFGPPDAERIVVGAHYDACMALPGADDNASGVAGLLELAGLLAQDELAVRVELVAYALEEPPYFSTSSMGSRVHAEGLRAQGVRVRAMIALEMIGVFRDEPGSQDYPAPGFALLYPDRGDFITVVGCLGQAGLVRRVKRAMAGAMELPVRSINAPRAIPGIDFSDQLNYWDAGFDAVMITDTAFYRNPNYHEATDTPETLDYPRMAEVVAGVHAAVLALADR